MNEVEVIEKPELKKVQKKTHPKRRLKEHDLKARVYMASMPFSDNAVTEAYETVVELVLVIP